MKDAFCIGCYPSNDKLKRLLKDNLYNLKKSENFDIFVSTHYKEIDKEVIDLVDYFIYDINNEKLSKEYSPGVEIVTDTYRVGYHTGGHGIAGMKNINNTVGLAESLGYKFFYYTEGDNVFSENDIKKIISIKEKCKFLNKKMFIPSYGYNVDFGLFGGDPKYFRENIKLPVTTEEWLNFYWYNKKEFLGENDQSIERIFYLKYKDYFERDYLVIDKEIKLIFNESILNGYRHGLLVTGALYNTDNPLKPVLYINNLLEESYRVVVELNGNIQFNDFVLPRHWWLNYFDIDNYVISFKCYNDKNELEKEVTYNIDKSDPLKLQDIGFIEWKK